MEEYSDLLQNQIRQYLNDSHLLDPSLKEFLKAIDHTYRLSETEHVLHHQALDFVLTPTDTITESAALLRSMLNDQTEMVCRFLADGTLTFVNDAYCRYFGKARKELVGNSFMPVIPEEDIAEIKKTYQTLSSNNAMVQLEHRVLMPDGNVRWHQWTDKAFFDKKGQIIEMLGIGRDITEQKQAELELKESEERYRTLFESTFEGIVVHDGKVILEANQASLQTMQYTQEEITGRSILDFILPSLREEVSERMHTSSGEPFETIILKRDGTPVYVEILSRKHLHRGKEVRVAAYRDISQRKLYEKEIHTQKTLLNKILNKLPIDIFIKDSNGQYVFINQHMAKKFGMVSIEVLGKTDFDIFSHEVASSMAAAEQKVWENKQPILTEEKVVYKEKPVHLLSGKRIVETDDSDNPLLLGYSIDITDRARAEEELRAQETFMRQVLDTSPNLIFVKDAMGNFMLVNQATADIFDMSKDELTLQNNYKVHTQPEENENFSKTDQRVINQGITIELEEPFTKPNGETLWYHTIKKPLYLKDGSIHVLAISQDITEQRRMLEKLKTSEIKYRQLVECATDMIHGCNHKGYFIYANPVTCHMLGYTEEELLRKHFSEFVVPEYLPILEALYKKQYAERIPDTYVEFKGITGKGEVIWVGQNVHMLLEGDRLLGFQTVARNITERKKVDEELLKAKQEAEKSMQAKEQFLSVMSHEIRTPLNAVIGLTHLLLEENPLAEQIEQLNAIKFSADNLMVIINDILDFSKIESGKIHFEHIDFELPAIFKGIQQSLGFKAEEKNLRLLFGLDEKLPQKLVGDPVRLNQILLNLVSNSIKFTEKGYVEVKAQVLKQQSKNITIEFRVTDTGIGIESEKLATIFESFTQASSETTRKYGGTGLGLTITKRLVELQGGAIHVNSRLGMGSEFVFYLNFGHANKLTETHIPVQEKPSLELKGLKVLLVEDNKMNQLVAGKFLKKWGVELEIAADGMEAIEKLKRNKYDLILMDLQMPHLDGYAATHFIRNNMQEWLKYIPILALTASALSDVKQNVLQAGMDDFITKPFNPKDLYDKLLKYAPATYKHMQHLQFSEQKYQHIDLNYLEDIAANDKQFMKEMIKLFIRQTPDFVSVLQRSAQMADWANIRYMVHKIKATIAMMGIAELQPIIMQLEKYASQENHLGEVAQLVDKIKSICTEVYAELEEKLELIK